MPLTFNHTDALTLTEDACKDLKGDDYTTAATAEPVRYLRNVSGLNLDDRAYQQTGVMGLNPSINRGCISNWAWMSNRENSSNYYDSKLLYSYYHAGTDSIMALAMVKMDKNTLGVHASMDLEDENQYYVKTVKASQADFNEADLFDGDQKGNALVHIMPVVAGAKVLNADEINSMIDADESFLNFTNASTTRVPGYTRGNDYVRADDANYDKKTVKFTILDLKGKAATVYNNPFDTTWYAVESDYKMLQRHNFSGKDDDPSFAHTLKSHSEPDRNNRNPYAGYNILFKNEVSGLFLKVLNDLHESGNQGNYNALKVNGAEYTYSEYNRPMIGDEARFHWKVTYYATNDSLVLEPLNASRHDYEGDDPIDGSQDAREFFNTVNKGNAFAPSTTAQQAFNKEKGVPVALYLMNIGAPQADSQYLLTVGTPSGLNTFEAYKYPAVPKFDATEIVYDGFRGEVAGDNPAYVTNARSYDVLYTPGNTSDSGTNANAIDANGQDIVNTTASSGSVVVTDGEQSEDYNLLYPKQGRHPVDALEVRS